MTSMYQSNTVYPYQNGFIWEPMICNVCKMVKWLLLLFDFVNMCLASSRFITYIHIVLLFHTIFLLSLLLLLVLHCIAIIQFNKLNVFDVQFNISQRWRRLRGQSFCIAAPTVKRYVHWLFIVLSCSENHAYFSSNYPKTAL